MKRISEYLMEAVARRTVGKYKIQLIFPEGKVKDEYNASIESLKASNAHQFYCNGDNYYKDIDIRSRELDRLRKRGKNIPDVVEYCVLPNSLARPAIIVIGRGKLESGKIACVLRYTNKDGEIHLLATHFFEYNGSTWIRTSGPDSSGWGDPREHEEEINAMLAK